MPKMVNGIRGADDTLYQFTPPMATSTQLGGVRAKFRSDEDQDVVIDEFTGLLYTKDASSQKISQAEEEINRLSVSLAKLSNEVSQARISIDNTTYISLKEKLDSIETVLKQLNTNTINIHTDVQGNSYANVTDAIQSSLDTIMEKLSITAPSVNSESQIKIISQDEYDGLTSYDNGIIYAVKK